MGGKGSGGSRVGAGRKPKDITAKILHGTASLAERREHAGAVPGALSPPSLPVEQVPPPRGLSKNQLRVWQRLAPHALANRTLTAATTAAFQDLCEAIVVRRDLFKKIRREGYTYMKAFYDKEGNLLGQEPKVHPLLSQYRGMMQRVEAGMTRFMLAPIGKELFPEAPKEKDPFDDFDDEPTTH